MIMAEFSCFPTAHWAERFALQTAVHWKRAESLTENSALFSSIPSHISWQQLHHLLQQLATQLAPEYQNRTFAYVGSHRLAGLLCYLTVIAMGGRILMLNPAFTEPQQQALLDELAVDYLIHDHHFAKFSEKLTGCKLAEWQPEQPATLTLTSGSSGNPKAVVHNVQQHLQNAEGVCHALGFCAQHSWLLSLPLFHVSGQGIVWRWLLQGAVLNVNEDKADFYTVLAESSHASLVATQLQRYLNSADFANRPDAQTILLGGSHIPSDLNQQAKQQGLKTYIGYGMTEMASTICAEQESNDTVGKPLLGREVKIEHDEIFVKGSCLALGYWQKGRLLPFATRNAWFPTKDKGCWTAEGKLQVLGRLDNMFISGGENIQPEQIEQILYRSNLLKNVIVLPKADDEFGFRPVAFVEFLGEFNPQAVELLQNFAKSTLERFKQPIAYIEIDGQFKQSGIKISRQQLHKHLKTIFSEHYHGE